MFASMEAIYGLWSEANFGWSAHDLGFAFLALGSGGLIAQLALIGPLSARFGEARVILIGLTLLALSMVLQPVIRLPIAGVLLMGLLMMGHSLTFPTAGALLSRNTPPERQGSTMGLMMASNAVGRIVAPPLRCTPRKLGGGPTEWIRLEWPRWLDARVGAHPLSMFLNVVPR